MILEGDLVCFGWDREEVGRVEGVSPGVVIHGFGGFGARDGGNIHWGFSAIQGSLSGIGGHVEFVASGAVGADRGGDGLFHEGAFDAWGDVKLEVVGVEMNREDLGDAHV